MNFFYQIYLFQLHQIQLAEHRKCESSSPLDSDVRHDSSLKDLTTNIVKETHDSHMTTVKLSHAGHVTTRLEWEGYSRWFVRQQYSQSRQNWVKWIFQNGYYYCYKLSLHYQMLPILDYKKILKNIKKYHYTYTYRSKIKINRIPNLLCKMAASTAYFPAADGQACWLIAER